MQCHVAIGRQSSQRKQLDSQNILRGNPIKINGDNIFLTGENTS